MTQSKVHVRVVLDVIVMADDNIDIPSMFSCCPVNIDDAPVSDVMKIQDVKVLKTSVTDSK